MNHQESHARTITHRAASLIAAGALSLSLTPAVALAESDDAAQSQQIEQTEEAPNTDAANEPSNEDSESKTSVPEEPATSENEAATQAAPEAMSLAQPIAKIGETNYTTFDEAVSAAADGSTIELLADATTAGLNLSKNLTIDGGKDKHALTFTDKGIALWGKSLTLKNVTSTMSGIGSTPYTAEWNWMTVCASKDASLTLDNATLSMDGSGAGNKHAIYFCSNNKLNLINASNLTIRNYQQDALEWDGGNGGYNVNIESGSRFTSDHNRSGFTGTFVAKIADSTVEVINSTGNGSNGSHFDIQNSQVHFDNNGSHGLSAGWLKVNNSTVTANGNGGNGIHTTSAFTAINNSVVEANGNKCSISSKWTIPGALHISGSGESFVDASSKITATNNQGAGLLLKNGALQFEEGSSLTIMGNTAEKLGQGGGVDNRGTLMLPSTAKIYNNHAAVAGDDILNAEGATISFGSVGTNWVLDDCNHAITGWFDDSEASKEIDPDASSSSAEAGRWSAHGENKHVVEHTDFLNGEITSELALKAAHGLAKVNYVWVSTDNPTDVQAPTSDADLEVGAGYTAKVQDPSDGWTFDGWYIDEACTEKWVDDTALEGNMTLYGKWTKNEVPAEVPEEPAVTPEEPNSPNDSADNTTKKEESQDEPEAEQLTKTNDSTMPFGFGAAACAALAASAAFASRKFLKR